LRGVFGFEVVVDEDNQGKRKASAVKMSMDCSTFSSKHAEVGLFEVGDQFAELIFNGDGKK